MSYSDLNPILGVLTGANSSSDLSTQAANIYSVITGQEAEFDLGVSVNPSTQYVSAATNPITVQPAEGYDAMSSVTVNAVTNSIDPNIAAGNIKEGVTILGVTGTLAGGSYSWYKNFINPYGGYAIYNSSYACSCRKWAVSTSGYAGKKMLTINLNGATPYVNGREMINGEGYGTGIPSKLYNGSWTFAPSVPCIRSYYATWVNGGSEGSQWYWVYDKPNSRLVLTGYGDTFYLQGSTSTKWSVIPTPTIISDSASCTLDVHSMTGSSATVYGWINNYYNEPAIQTNSASYGVVLPDGLAGKYAVQGVKVEDRGTSTPQFSLMGANLVA